MATNTKTLRQKPQKTTLVSTDAVTITDASGNVYYMNVSDLKNALVPALASEAEKANLVSCVDLPEITDMAQMRQNILNATRGKGLTLLKMRCSTQTFINDNWNNDSYVITPAAYALGLAFNPYGSASSILTIIWTSHIINVNKTVYNNGTWTNYQLTQTQL